ncbi:MAG: hypothetical protein DWQ42_15785 [Planctomycetota bacterium]|nr:MAG: hypothetical protein DWQ42_15785 [Planctomycetota bacterium]REK49370.1 MAG: hypothetical protein DWQ46_00465 [Planctomycetota bacterium]
MRQTSPAQRRQRFTRPHWSFSQVAQYQRCPLQYYFERIARLPRPFTPTGLALGSAVHAALAACHEQLMQGGQPLREPHCRGGVAYLPNGVPENTLPARVSRRGRTRTKESEDNLECILA